MKRLPALLNLIVLAFIVAYLALELIYAPPKYFSPTTVKFLTVLAIPFSLTLISLQKKVPRAVRIIGIAVNAIFVPPLAMVVMVLSLNIGGTAPLAVFLLPPTLLIAMNTAVLLKASKTHQAVEDQGTKGPI